MQRCQTVERKKVGGDDCKNRLCLHTCADTHPTGESGKEATLPVVAFRRSKRVCIVAGGAEVVKVAQEMATVGKEALTAANVVVLPVRLRGVSSLDSEAVR